MNNSISSIFSGIELPDLTPMRTGQAQGWGFKYTWVSLAVTELNRSLDTVSLARTWSQTQFGPSGHRWFEKQGRFYFKDQRDLTVFLLRWS